MKITLQRWPMLAGLAFVSACALQDLTDPPQWDLRLNFPTTASSISVSTMLPTGVSMNGAGTAFLVTAPASSVTQTLAQACPTCVPLNGLTAPKPAFTFTQASTSALPGDVASATLASGTLAISIANGYSFDPLAVAGGTPGTIVITVTDANNRQLAKDSLNGATTTLAGGTTLTRTLALAPGSLRGPLTVTAAVGSPAGGAITVNTAQTLVVTGTPQNIAVSAAQVTVTNKQISSSATELDLSDVESDISQRITAAAIFVGLTNPFNVTGNLNLRFQGPGVDFSKTLTLAAGATNPTIMLTTAEIDAVMGKKITLTASGPVTAAAAVTVTPTDRVNITPRLEVTVSTEKR